MGRRPLCWRGGTKAETPCLDAPSNRGRCGQNSSFKDEEAETRSGEDSSSITPQPPRPRGSNLCAPACPADGVVTTRGTCGWATVAPKEGGALTPADKGAVAEGRGEPQGSGGLTGAWAPCSRWRNRREAAPGNVVTEGVLGALPLGLQCLFPSQSCRPPGGLRVTQILGCLRAELHLSVKKACSRPWGQNSSLL